MAIALLGNRCALANFPLHRTKLCLARHTTCLPTLCLKIASLPHVLCYRSICLLLQFRAIADCSSMFVATNHADIVGARAACARTKQPAQGWHPIIIARQKCLTRIVNLWAVITEPKKLMRWSDIIQQWTKQIREMDYTGSTTPQASFQTRSGGANWHHFAIRTFRLSTYHLRHEALNGLYETT